MQQECVIIYNLLGSDVKEHVFLPVDSEHPTHDELISAARRYLSAKYGNVCYQNNNAQLIAYRFIQVIKST